MTWDKEIEKKIQEALETGAFENLPGKGEPLSLNQNPYEDPSWAMAFHLLKSNEFTLPWIEKRRGIEKQIDAACKKLLRAWKKQHKQTGLTEPNARDNWDRAVFSFRQQLDDVNHQIRTYNLEVPLDQLYIYPLDADREIVKLKESGALGAD